MDNQVHPKAVDEFNFPKTLFEEDAFLAGMDKGCSLVKILYRAKPQPTDYPDQVRVICETYLNSDFYGGIDNFVERVYMPKEPGQLTLCVTGAGCEREMDMLKQKTAMNVKYVDEFFCQAKGTHWLINHAKAEQLFYDDCVTIYNALDLIPHNSYFNCFREKFQAVVDEQREQFASKLPCFMAFMGSAVGFLEVQESGSVKFAGLYFFGGKTFLSLAKLLLQTTDYTEIMDLAEAGDSCQVDTLIGEMFLTDPDSAFGENNPNMPLFAFGKAFEQNRDLESFKREDLAAALVNLAAVSTATTIYNAARATGFLHVYIGGNMCRNKLFRKAISDHMSFDMVQACKPMEVRYMKTGHTGAFGTMLINPEEHNKLY